MNFTDGGIGRLGVVGASGDKWTDETEAAARREIREAISRHRPELVVSGRCPTGGVDIWAIEEARKAGISYDEYAPEKQQWAGRGGYRERNLRIAKLCDLVLCVVPRTLPWLRRFGEHECYHCMGRNPPHVKSGGCWTAWQCEAREWRIIG